MLLERITNFKKYCFSLKNFLTCKPCPEVNCRFQHLISKGSTLFKVGKHQGDGKAVRHLVLRNLRRCTWMINKMQNALLHPLSILHCQTLTEWMKKRSHLPSVFQAAKQMNKNGGDDKNLKICKKETGPISFSTNLAGACWLCSRASGNLNYTYCLNNCVANILASRNARLQILIALLSQKSQRSKNKSPS